LFLILLTLLAFGRGLLFFNLFSFALSFRRLFDLLLLFLDSQLVLTLSYWLLDFFSFLHSLFKLLFLLLFSKVSV
jgi:hypothetical protein